MNIMTVIFNGLSTSSILLITALGLAITFGLMRVINMAHGEFIMIGAYTTYVVQNLFSVFLPSSVFDAYYIVALFAAFGVAFAIGVIMEKLIVSRLYGNEIDSLLATWGVSLILQQLARSIFGAQPVNVKAPSFLQGNIGTGDVTFSYVRIFIIVMMIFCLVGVWLLMYRTNFGSKMRATMQNRSMAQCLGINTKKMDSITFGIGSGLAGIAGCSISLLFSIDSTLGTKYIVDTFMVVVLGGVGKLLGTFCGADIIGFSSVFMENLTSASIAKFIVLIIVIVFLQKKPQGLFTIRSRSLDD